MHPKSLGLLLSVALVVVAGCRSYGGYGSEEVMYRQIGQMIERFEEDLARARAQLSALERAAENDPVLGELVDRYALLVLGEEAILDENRRLAEELSPEASYRSLRRVHGSILAAQRTVRVQREGLLREFLAATDTAGVEDFATVVVGERPYALIPPYYARIENAQQTASVSDFLRQSRNVGSGPMVDDDGVETPSGVDTTAGDATETDTAASDTASVN